MIPRDLGKDLIWFKPFEIEKNKEKKTWLRRRVNSRHFFSFFSCKKSQGFFHN